MVAAALQRITYAFGRLNAWRARGDARKSGAAHYTIGRYHANYEELSSEELSASDSEADALIKRSPVISAKRGL